MAKLFVFLMAACCLAASGQTTQAVAVPSAATMPRERAEATLKDPRFLAFLKNVTHGFKVSCTLPDPAHTAAKVTLPNLSNDAPPEVRGYASTWYEVAVPCSGVTVTVNAEFTPLAGDTPLNLVLSLRQVFER